MRNITLPRTFALAMIVLVGCSGPDQPSGATEICESGETQPCTCTSGEMGAQICEADNEAPRWGGCVCGATPATDPGSGDANDDQVGSTDTDTGDTDTGDTDDSAGDTNPSDAGSGDAGEADGTACRDPGTCPCTADEDPCEGLGCGTVVDSCGNARVCGVERGACAQGEVCMQNQCACTVGLDACGVCGGSDACQGCDGVPDSGRVHACASVGDSCTDANTLQVCSQAVDGCREASLQDCPFGCASGACCGDPALLCTAGQCGVVRNACGESADCGNAACADGEVCEQNQCLCLAGEGACELPEVLCGSSVCPVVDDTICCDDWTDSGWGTPSCSPRSECDDLTPGFIGPPQQWDLASACDGKDDCDEGQFCCFSGQGQPGAGAGRACMTESQCNTGSTDEAELGLGLYSCVSEADCPDSGQTCAAEVTGSETTSASQGGPFGVDNIPGRPHVKVCTPE